MDTSCLPIKHWYCLSLYVICVLVPTPPIWQFWHSLRAHCKETSWPWHKSPTIATSSAQYPLNCTPMANWSISRLFLWLREPLAHYNGDHYHPQPVFSMHGSSLKMPWLSTTRHGLSSVAQSTLACF